MYNSISIPRHLPERIGFRIGDRGTQTSRTIMISELTQLLAVCPPDAIHAEYWSAITDDNVLGKKTAATRKLSAQRLSELYGLTPDAPLFRVLRQLWDADPQSHPLLACLCANARDPLLRMTAPAVLSAPVGEQVRKEDIAALIHEQTGDRFNPSTRDKIARNAASSWTQSGHLSGRSIKVREKPIVTSANVAYALLLGYLAGDRDQALLDTFWIRMLDIPRADIEPLAIQAAQRGWIDYKHFGGVVSVSFHDILTEKELEVINGEGG